jgi:hypothetical protein
MMSEIYNEFLYSLSFFVSNTLICQSSTCPEAYLFPDDNSKTNSCKTGGTYILTFCPGGTVAGGGHIPTPAPTAPPSSIPPSKGYLQSKSNGLYVVLNSGSVLVATGTSMSSAVLFAFAPVAGSNG